MSYSGGQWTVLTRFLVNACDVVWVKYFRNTSEASWITTQRVGVAWRQNQQQDVHALEKKITWISSARKTQIQDFGSREGNKTLYSSVENLAHLKQKNVV